MKNIIYSKKKGVMKFLIKIKLVVLLGSLKWNFDNHALHMKMVVMTYIPLRSFLCGYRKKITFAPDSNYFEIRNKKYFHVQHIIDVMFVMF